MFIDYITESVSIFCERYICCWLRLRLRDILRDEMSVIKAEIHTALSISMSHLVIIGLGALGIGLAQIYRPRSNLLLVGKPAQVQQLADVYPVSSLHDLRLEDDSTILICTQAFGVEPVLSVLQSKLNKTHSVVILCNGLGIYSEALQFVPQNLLLRGSVSTGFLKVDAVQVQQSGDLKIELAGKVEKLRHAQQMFEHCGAKINIVDSPQLLEWRKVIVNAVVNSLCTIANVQNGALITDPRLNELTRSLLADVQTVGLHACAELTPISESDFFKGLENYADNINSTLAAYRAKRPTESEYLLGAVVRIARQSSLKLNCLEEIWIRLVQHLKLSEVETD